MARIRHKSKRRFSRKPKAKAPFSWKEITRGGSFYRPAAPIPGPFVGDAWGPAPQMWPGVDGIGDNRNYLALNEYHRDPKMMIIGGVKKRRGQKKTLKKRKRGGTIIPQPLLNFSDSIVYQANRVYNTLRGVDAPVNPLPYKDQL